jgi:thioredoxin-dependent peroxiredoxin
MATITLGGQPCTTIGTIPQPDSASPHFNLVGKDLKPVTSEDFRGQNLVLNIFPSVGTGVCATSARTFNKLASELRNTSVICISKDLPFAMHSFCAAEGLENVIMASDFVDGSFGKEFGVTILDGGFKGLLSRAVVVIGSDGKVLYSQQVQEISDEPDYDAALNAIK